MVRVQVRLTEEQVRRLRELAAARGVSVAALVRESVDRLFEDPSLQTVADRRRRAMSIVGCGCSGLTDVAVRHDDHLLETFES